MNPPEPIKPRKRRPTSDMLDEVLANQQNDTLTVDEIKAALQRRGFGVLLALAALPLCLPVPMPPGYTTLFSIPLFILSLQMLVGRRTPWLPRWLGRKEIKRTTLAKFVEKANPFLRRIERKMKPRWGWAGSPAGEKLIGLFAFIFTCSIAIPLPMTNVPPGIGILLMALGLLSRDGVMILIGKFIGILGIILTASVLILGSKAVSAILGI